MVGDPAALGGIVGEVEDFEKDLVIFEGGDRGGGLLEGGIGAGEGGEVGGVVVEDPLTGLCWKGHGGLFELCRSARGRIGRMEKVWRSENGGELCGAFFLYATDDTVAWDIMTG